MYHQLEWQPDVGTGQVLQESHLLSLVPELLVLPLKFK